MRCKLLLLLALSSLVLSIVPPWPSRWEEALPESFNWSSVEPQWKLRYAPCYEGLECARYLVPLDWTHLGLEKWKEVALAVARLPAKVNQSDPSFGGTVVLNPGGPSGSGVDLLRWAGRGIQEIIDGEKHFEILAFDPRGTKYSTPSTACFESDEDRELWMLQNSDVGSVDEGKFSLDVRWALLQGFSTLCDQTNLGVLPDGTNIRQYVSTSQVAYDMVKLTDAIAEELTYSLASQPRTTSSQQILSDYRVPVLNYWGYSYGTYLGNTYASMFAGRTGRMILDGVVDAPDYTATGWSSNLQDNDKVWDFFYQWCLDAGPACALYDDTIEKSSDLQAKLILFADFLRNNPMSIVDDGKVYLLTYSDLQATMHFASYGPYQVWPWLAISLQQLMQGNAEAFISLHQTSSSSKSPFFPQLGDNILDPFNKHATPYPPGYSHGLEASTSILCGDGEDITSDTKADFLSYLSLLKNQSTLVGPNWAQITLSCRQWPNSQRPAKRNRFTGPFTSKWEEYQQDGRASPLLFIGNTADPVTPLRNAVKMAAQHENASVLIQNTPGHCSGVTIPSNCTWKAISDYFNYGKLPTNGTVCEVDWQPWDHIEA